MISVLYIDDEPDLLDIGRRYLEKSGQFAVTTAESVPAARELIRTRPFDAIISDYQMPETDGIAFLQEIRRSSDIPFILFTGRGREKVFISAIDSGATFYLQKGGELPAQFAELSHKVTQAVRHRQAEQALRNQLELIRQTSEISTRFIRITGNEIDQAIRETLAQVGSQCRADRSYIALIDPSGTTVSLTHEWTAGGIRPVAGELGSIPIAKIPWINTTLQGHGIISIPRIADLPDEPGSAGDEKQRLLRQEIKSLLLIPLTVGSTLIGAIGMDAVTKEMIWPEEEIAILQIYGQIIANALARRNAFMLIARSEELYRTVFEESNTPMLILEEDMTISAINRQMERLGGYNSARIEGKIPWTQFFSQPEVSRMMEYHRRRRTDPVSVPAHYTCEFQGSGGQIIGSRVSVAMIPGSMRSIVSLTPFPAESNAPVKSPDSGEKFRCLTESLPEAVCLIQGNRFVYVNTAFARLFGYSTEELPALPDFTAIFLEIDRQRMRTAVENRMNGISDAERYIVRSVRPDGRTMAVSISGSMTRYRGSPAFIGTATAITGL